MILIALGSNLVTAEFDTSQKLLECSLKSLEQNDVQVLRRSSWYRSAPIPASDQPWFVNGVAEIASPLSPKALLGALHAVEDEYGRMRSQRNESRTLDLDLLVYDDQVINEMDGLVLPHPRLQERAFVLLPLAEVAPRWRHPVSGLTAAEMLDSLPPGQQVERIAAEE
ncbi:2-amino-4-hydroxy-6-hydroxymethyldihydropteridine diphosphokinase [Pelagibius marinus]|uniref:2-amino-4-hydroxy-6- hydroxymethyldihydropteridine diphosphokinase n=1 Tax=Pelagibius marinus TaxID=2762760 RepID=UPI00187217A2|nr:2-amino-4-hydroxy-6-hydroxymethyldihydropteridine diphosphokinase [Pelagibius marinus]